MNAELEERLPAHVPAQLKMQIRLRGYLAQRLKVLMPKRDHNGKELPKTWGKIWRYALTAWLETTDEMEEKDFAVVFACLKTTHTQKEVDMLTHTMRETLKTEGARKFGKLCRFLERPFLQEGNVTTPYSGEVMREVGKIFGHGIPDWFTPLVGMMSGRVFVEVTKQATSTKRVSVDMQMLLECLFQNELPKLGPLATLMRSLKRRPDRVVFTDLNKNITFVWRHVSPPGFEMSKDYFREFLEAVKLQIISWSQENTTTAWFQIIFEDESGVVLHSIDVGR